MYHAARPLRVVDEGLLRRPRARPPTGSRWSPSASSGVGSTPTATVGSTMATAARAGCFGAGVNGGDVRGSSWMNLDALDPDGNVGFSTTTAACCGTSSQPASPGPAAPRCSRASAAVSTWDHGLRPHQLGLDVGPGRRLPSLPGRTPCGTAPACRAGHAAPPRDRRRRRRRARAHTPGVRRRRRPRSAPAPPPGPPGQRRRAPRRTRHRCRGGAAR